MATGTPVDAARRSNGPYRQSNMCGTAAIPHAVRVFDADAAHVGPSPRCQPLMFCSLPQAALVLAMLNSQQRPSGVQTPVLEQGLLACCAGWPAVRRSRTGNMQAYLKDLRAVRS